MVLEYLRSVLVLRPLFEGLLMESIGLVLGLDIEDSEFNIKTGQDPITSTLITLNCLCIV